jgi:hypothetical protein
MSEKITFKRPDGKSSSGHHHIAPCAGERAPGVVVVQPRVDV